MTDIVERLRKREMLAEIGQDRPEIYRDAADEIERLRKDLRIAIMGDSAELTDSKEEIHRLRLALHEIYEIYAGSEGIPEPVTCPEAYLLSLLQQMVEIAKEHKND